MKPLAQNTLIQNRYLIVHLIGKGGMGEVYLAVDQRLGSAVALKRTFFAGDETLGNAFEREAKTLARMRHPVLPRVSDHFGENDDQYLVMEHISGDDLAKRLEGAQKPFPVSWVLFWADQLLDALTYLHSHEPPIIHRDIKPQNLKLTDENHIILLDFGLSKTSTGQTNISQSGSTGSVVGYTPHYAPMEQIRGIGTNARSDLYSLSATIYQLMTNTMPPDALSRADSMLNELPDPIRPPFEINPEIPKNVSDVILRGMELSQEKRFATAYDMQKVLRKAFTEMQQAMSAETVAFTIQDDQAIAIEPPLAGSLPQNDVPEIDEFESQQTHVPSSMDTAEVQDFDATIAFDSPLATNLRKQSELKTEVFLAGGTPFSVTEEELSPPFNQQSNDWKPDAAESFAETGASASNDYGSAQQEYLPDATTPFIDLSGHESEVANGSNETPDFYTSTGVVAQPDDFGSPFEESQSEGNAENVSDLNRQAVIAPAKKKSAGKIFAVLGGLAALFILAVIAAGGGWYYYANYYAAAAVVEPTPSPEPSVEASPSPEPTLETVFESNSSNNNSNTESVLDSETNTNSRSEVLTVEPTPAPTEPGTAATPRIAPEVGPKATPSKSPRTPGSKATPKPKPKPTNDGPTILQ